MAMKLTLLEIVQKTLSDMDSEGVNSISDTLEAQQIASIAEDVYFGIVAGYPRPDEMSLIKLTALSDTVYPTHFEYPTNVKNIAKVSYNVSLTSVKFYKEILFLEPLDFLTHTDNQSSGYTDVPDKSAGTTLFIANDRMPTYYTSFDEKYIVFDSHDSATDVTLQESKTRAYGQVFPTFSLTDSFVPDLENTMFPYYLAEVKSQTFSLFKQAPDPKIEQQARRLKASLQNDTHKTTRGNRLNVYGR